MDRVEVSNFSVLGGRNVNLGGPLAPNARHNLVPHAARETQRPPEPPALMSKFTKENELPRRVYLRPGCGHQPFPAGSGALTMVDQNGTTLAQPDMLTDCTFKTIFVAA